MSKRFTDTDKWKKPFIKSLPTEYKIFWLFLLDECDHSGIWHVEMEVVEARLGIKLSLEKIRGFFKEKIVEFDSGTKMFIPDFVSFQYGVLNPENKAHRSVIGILNKYNLMGLVSPLVGAKDKAKDMDMEKEKDKDTKEDLSENQKMHYDAEQLILASKIWFEQLCMNTGKTKRVAELSLRKYHLHLIDTEAYPKSKKQILAGFEKWLLGDKQTSGNQENRIVPPVDADNQW